MAVSGCVGALGLGDVTETERREVVLVVLVGDDGGRLELDGCDGTGLDRRASPPWERRDRLDAAVSGLGSRFGFAVS